MAAKKASGVSEAYLRDLHNRTRSLPAFDNGNVNDLTPEQMARYFESLNFGAI